MPLVAISKSTGKRVESFKYSSSIEIKAKFSDLICPFCEGRMFSRGRKDYILHFVHTHECTTTLKHHPESPEHLLGKKVLYEHLKAELSAYSDVEVAIEYPIPEAGEHGRIADVAAVFRTGYVLVYECQLAAISTAELSERTLDYASAGADVCWFLGGKANTESNRGWCISEFGVSHHLLFSHATSGIREVILSGNGAVDDGNGRSPGVVEVL